MDGSAAGPLTAAQIATFKRQGFVRIPGFFPLSLVDQWREQVPPPLDHCTGPRQ